MDDGVRVARRNLLLGKPVSAAPPLRPPGALVEASFLSACTACGKCSEACPQKIIIVGSGGYPEINFSHSECVFCSECIDSCPENALQPLAEPRLNIRLELSESCLAQRQIVCRTCGDECEAQAIRFSPRLGAVPVPIIDQDSCTGCGACISACPEGALAAIAHA